jgi:hypothetical protein
VRINIHDTYLFQETDVKVLCSILNWMDVMCSRDLLFLGFFVFLLVLHRLRFPSRSCLFTVNRCSHYVLHGKYSSISMQID